MRSWKIGTLTTLAAGACLLLAAANVLFGSVSGVTDDSITSPFYYEYVAEGVIDVDRGSVYMNGGSLINQYGGSKIKFGFSASEDATVIINDGYIKAYDAVIMDVYMPVIDGIEAYMKRHKVDKIKDLTEILKS